ncbi:TolC family protein [Mucilaginibacter terrae]|uniref:Outer membrane protein TolC n=1 Tax=Mucilaginibacter terrae TaxID=1955052 RepID=A0ABU3GWR8_9SPHI|nr:TolC family protein [Mucilaginibacter terrae]MDT3404213.1 outer membrane protein TolC [Mucilaginibacter terrae]
MNRIFTVVIVLLLTAFAAPQSLRAQNSIVSDISEPYLQKLIATAKANYPRVKSLDERVAIAQNNVSRQRLSYLDALTFSYVYQPNTTLNLNALQPGNVDGSATGVNNRTSIFKGTQFGLFFNLGSYLQKPFAVKQARRELTIANNDVQEYLLTLATQVRKRYYTYVQRIASLKLQTQAAIDAEGVMKDVKYRFEKGEVTVESYNQARISNTQQIQAKITAETDLFTAKADLEELLGEKLENIR